MTKRRLISKKSPRNWTPRQQWSLFLILTLLLWAATAIFLRALVWSELRANHFFVESRCTVLDKHLKTSYSDGRATYRPDILVRYSVDGATYDVWTYDASHVYRDGPGRQGQFVIGNEYPCWYDPDEPHTAVLVLGYTWLAYPFLLIPFVIWAALLIGFIQGLRLNRRLAKTARTPNQ